MFLHQGAIRRDLSQFLTNLMHKICFTMSFISRLYMFRAHVLETCRGVKWNLLWNKFCASSWLNTEMHGQQNVKIIMEFTNNKEL